MGRRLREGRWDSEFSWRYTTPEDMGESRLTSGKLHVTHHGDQGFVYIYDTWFLARLTS